MKLSAPIFRLKRDAKALSRHEAIPLHQAQDRIARAEGFQRWSQLAAHHASTSTGTQLLNMLSPGDLVILAGKREHGKTTLAFDVMADAVNGGRACRYFSLDENGVDIEHRLEAAGADATAAHELFAYDTSDDISAPYITDQAASLGAGALIVVDYLQLLDQQRHKPELSDQVRSLRAFANESTSIIIVLSQIDRGFDLSGEASPGLEHIRLPNVVDLTLFTKSCFIHDGEIRLEAVS